MKGGVQHPTWCARPCEDKTYGDGAREVVHHLRLDLVEGHDAWLISYQYVDAAGFVTVHDQVVHLGGDGPLSPADARRLAAALVRGAALLEACPAATVVGSAA